MPENETTEECEQVELFRDFFDEPLVQAVQRYAHTGKRLAGDPVEVESIVSDLCAGASYRAVARRYGRSRHTIAAILSSLEAAGKLAPIKQRVSAKLGHAMEMALDNSIEMLERGKVPANVLPVMVGVFADKKALLDGEATVRVERVEVVDEGSLRKGLEAWIDREKARRQGVGMAGAVAVTGAEGGMAGENGADSGAGLVIDVPADGPVSASDPGGPTDA